MADQVRIDQWLWAVRIFKTRSLASEECKKGRVTIDGTHIKPSRAVKIGDIIEVKKTPVTYHYKVLDLIKKRVGAKLVPDYMRDVTPKENLEILEVQRYMAHSVREKGAGRPTKRDRRDIDKFKGGM